MMPVEAFASPLPFDPHINENPSLSHVLILFQNLSRLALTFSDTCWMSKVGSEVKNSAAHKHSPEAQAP
jgi:hypothetical protein